MEIFIYDWESYCILKRGSHLCSLGMFVISEYCQKVAMHVISNILTQYTIVMDVNWTSVGTEASYASPWGAVSSQQ